MTQLIRRRESGWSYDTDPLKILWLVPALPANSDDAAYVFLWNEIEWLSAEPDVEIVVLTESEPPSAAGFEVRQIRPPSTLPGKFLIAIWAFTKRFETWRLVLGGRWATAVQIAWRLKEIERFLARNPVDIVHSHFGQPEGTGAVALAQRRSIGTVMSLRGVEIAAEVGLGYGFCLDDLYRRRLSRALERVDLCLTATESMRREAIARGANPARSRVLRNGVQSVFSAVCSDTSVREGPESRGDRSRIRAVSVGNLIPLKGFDVGIRALALDESLHYLIVGDGPMGEELQDLAQQLGVSDRVEFAGRVPHQQLAGMLQDCDVYWLLSHREGFGNVVIEALSADLALVTTSVGVAAEIVPKADRAALITQDPAELTRATIRVLEMPRTDRDSLLSEFRPEERTRRLIAFYRSVLAQQSSRGRRRRQPTSAALPQDYHSGAGSK